MTEKLTTTDKTRLIPLTQNQFAIVDAEDYDKLMEFKWYARYDTHTKSFYARLTDYSGEKQKTILMHRLIMNTPECMNTDHANHDTLDNRKHNLRVCTKSQNMMNRRKQSNNLSGVTGVYLGKNNKKWRASIMVNRKNKHLGYFYNIKEAINCRKQAELKYFGEFAYNSEGGNQ